MDRCDVLIVGGGPAGSSCARRLHAAGLDVLIVEKLAFPRDKPCAGWITPQVVESLELDLDQYGRGRVCQPITGFRCGVIDGVDVQTTYDRPVSYGIRRCEFDAYLLDRSGARSRFNERVCQIERRNNLWYVNERFCSPLLVGAGGHFCPVARAVGAAPNQNGSVVVAQEVEFPVPSGQLERVGVQPEIPELFFCRDMLGYGWCFRKNNFLNIGLGRVDTHGVSARTVEFCEFLRRRGKVCCDVPSQFHGHAYRLYDGAQIQLIADGLLLIGDAAGLAYRQSGEGIRPAVESGLIAADVILRAAGDYQSEQLAQYPAQLNKRFGKRQTHSLTDFLPAAWLCRVASRLLATQWFTRHVVMDRWFLHAKQSAL